MKSTIPAIVIAVICLGSATVAQTPNKGKVGVDVTGNPQAIALMAQIMALEDGTYELKIADGDVTIVPLMWIVPDGPTPPPDDLTARGKEMRAACIRVTNDPNKELNTKKMVALYRQVKEQADNGTLTEQQSMAIVVKGAQELLLGEALQAWSPVTTQFGAHWATMVQDGRPAGDYAAYLAEAADGLESTLVLQDTAGEIKENDAIATAVAAAITVNMPDSDAADYAKALKSLRDIDREGLDPAMIKLIIELIMMIIDMFTDAQADFQPAVETPTATVEDGAVLLRRPWMTEILAA